MRWILGLVLAVCLCGRAAAWPDIDYVQRVEYDHTDSDLDHVVTYAVLQGIWATADDVYCLNVEGEVPTSYQEDAGETKDWPYWGYMSWYVFDSYEDVDLRTEQNKQEMSIIIYDDDAPAILLEETPGHYAEGSAETGACYPLAAEGLDADSIYVEIKGGGRNDNSAATAQLLVQLSYHNSAGAQLGSFVTIFSDTIPKNGSESFHTDLVLDNVPNGSHHVKVWTSVGGQPYDVDERAIAW